MKITDLPTKAIILDDFELSIIKKSLIEYHSFLQDSYDEKSEDDVDILDQIVVSERMLYNLKDY
jgi:hypothetical protein